MERELAQLQLGIRYPSFVATPPDSLLDPHMASWNYVTADYLIQSSIIVESDPALKFLKTFLEDYPSLSPTIGFLELPYLPHYPTNRPEFPNRLRRSAQLLAASKLPCLSHLRITLRTSELTEEIPEGDVDRRTVILDGTSHEYPARRPISLDTLLRVYDMEHILECRFLTFLDFIVINDSVDRHLCAPVDPCETVHELAAWFRHKYRLPNFQSQVVWIRVKIEVGLDGHGTKGHVIFNF